VDVTFEEKLEKEIDKMELNLPSLKNFIHPGGSLPSSHLHIARTIARKLERDYVAYSKDKSNNIYLKFFNRLSDFLFVSARYMNMLHKVDDIIISNIKH
jgi:cob(I)alamin adenosyltransferase